MDLGSLNNFFIPADTEALIEGGGEIAGEEFCFLILVCVGRFLQHARLLLTAPLPPDSCSVYSFSSVYSYSAQQPVTLTGKPLGQFCKEVPQWDVSQSSAFTSTQNRFPASVTSESHGNFSAIQQITATQCLYLSSSWEWGSLGWSLLASKVIAAPVIYFHILCSLSNVPFSSFAHPPNMPKLLLSLTFNQLLHVIILLLFWFLKSYTHVKLKD